ncbi:SDR family NAD(P)-dependent oxidoreductase [Gordonia polyisoprenivorans]|uniref:SDR family NAD(P)-dependent oxidoreductase n=1 Tax=Gordonia polyisoprenivorans TaxID=84595 RepID=UPI001AD7A4FB|nr:glucose 1-dehydrogenase [Gordonia polyisoprenivorans]QTI70960.1 glucose 1-dehydrogenase [Gordonia polyisoprenivorans]
MTRGLAHGVPVPAEFAGKVAVVTGGSRGIGRAIATGFAAAGADVVIASRKLDRCAALATELEQTYGVRCLPVAYHAAKWEDSERLADQVLERFGRCDVLVNNAGMSPFHEGITTISEDYYDKVLGVNLKGPFRLSVRLGAHIAEQGGGAIINISTIGSLRPAAHEIVYGMAKAGLNALTVALSGELAPKVRVNAILPGAVDTDIAAVWPSEMREAAIKLAPMGRFGVPDDFVGPALWLASERSAYVTGTLIRVDGGAYRQMS